VFFLVPHGDLQLVAGHGDISVSVRVNAGDLGFDDQGAGVTVFLDPEPGLQITFKEPADGFGNVDPCAAQNVTHWSYLLSVSRSPFETAKPGNEYSEHVPNHGVASVCCRFLGWGNGAAAPCCLSRRGDHVQQIQQFAPLHTRGPGDLGQGRVPAAKERHGRFPQGPPGHGKLILRGPDNRDQGTHTVKLDSHPAHPSHCKKALLSGHHAPDNLC
jgi:hypothetical protein